MNGERENLLGLPLEVLDEWMAYQKRVHLEAMEARAHLPPPPQTRGARPYVTTPCGCIARPGGKHLWIIEPCAEAWSIHKDIVLSWHEADSRLTAYCDRKWDRHIATADTEAKKIEAQRLRQEKARERRSR